jgi:hypothetical protein
MGVCGTGLGNITLPGDPNLNTPILTATSGRGGIDVSWTYPTLNPHGVAHTLVYRSTDINFETAALIRTVEGDHYWDQSNVTIGTTYYYWIRMVSVNGTIGDVIGPASATMQPPIQQLIDLMVGLISNSALDIALRTEIEKIVTLEGSIADEILDRLTGDNLLSQSIASVVSDLATVDTLVQNEINTRVTSDSAQVNQINLILATANSNTAAILALETTSAGDNSALASLITAIQATVASNTSAITTETTARSDGDTANASAITALQTEVDSNEAAILTEQTARADGDTANVNALTLLQVEVDANGAAILTEQTARANGDSANANSVTQLQATIDANAAAILTEQSARISGDSANASSTTTLQATVNGNTALIQTTADVVSGTDGLTAQYMVKSDVNGYVTGFGLYNDGATGDFIVHADRFAIGLPGEAGIFPFIIAPVNGETQIALNARTLIPDLHIVNAMIDNVIESSDGGTSWRIDKEGSIEGRSITIRDSSGNVILSSGGALSNLIANDQITLGGLGAGALATVEQLTSANIDTYMQNAAINSAHIDTLHAEKITGDITKVFAYSPGVTQSYNNSEGLTEFGGDVPIGQSLFLPAPDTHPISGDVLTHTPYALFTGDVDPYHLDRHTRIRVYMRDPNAGPAQSTLTVIQANLITIFQFTIIYIELTGNVSQVRAGSTFNYNGTSYVVLGTPWPTGNGSFYLNYLRSDGLTLTETDLVPVSTAITATASTSWFMAGEQTVRAYSYQRAPFSISGCWGIPVDHEVELQLTMVTRGGQNEAQPSSTGVTTVHPYNILLLGVR